MAPNCFPDVDDYIGAIMSVGLKPILGEMVSKKSVVYTPIVINIVPGVEARVRIFSQGNYTMFYSDGGFEGLDTEEFLKDLNELMNIYA